MMLLKLLITIFLIFISCQKVRNASEIYSKHSHGESLTEINYISPVKVLKCLDMIKSPGQWWYREEVEEQMCAVYLIGNPDEFINILIENVNIDCWDGEYIEIFDGWLASGNMLPSENDHTLPLESRIKKICTDEDWSSDVIRSIEMKASQNFALVQFRLKKGREIVINFARTENDSPCNVISPTNYGKYKMEIKAGEKKTCTFSIIYPSKITLSDLSLGLNGQKNYTKSSDKDKLYVLNGNTLRTQDLPLIATYEGPINESESSVYNLTKSHSAIKIFSNGVGWNRVTIYYSTAEDE